MKKQKEVIINGLLYHRYRFGWKNIKVWFCRQFGHQLNNVMNKYNCCQRCGLAYEEIYYKQILEKEKDDTSKNCSR